MKCNYASSGCNYPEAECAGLCMGDFEAHPRGTGEVLRQLRAEREALTFQVEDQRRLLERLMQRQQENYMANSQDIKDPEASELREVMAEVTRRFEELKRHGVPYQVHNEALAKRDAALVACVEAMEEDRRVKEIGRLPDTHWESFRELRRDCDARIDAAITQANEALGRKEG